MPGISLCRRSLPFPRATIDKAAGAGGLVTPEQEGLKSVRLSPTAIRAARHPPGCQANSPETFRLFRVLILTMHAYFSRALQFAPASTDRETTLINHFGSPP